MITYEDFVVNMAKNAEKALTRDWALIGQGNYPPVPKGQFPGSNKSLFAEFADVAQAYGDAHKFAAFPASVPTEKLRLLQMWSAPMNQGGLALPAPNVSKSDQIRIQYYYRAAALYALAVALQGVDDHARYQKEHVWEILGQGALNMVKTYINASKLDFDAIGKNAAKMFALSDLTGASDRTKDLATLSRTATWLGDQLAQEVVQAPIDAQNAATAAHTAQVAATKESAIKIGGLILGGIAVLLLVDSLTD
jgi:hypothetical protein